MKRMTTLTVLLALASVAQGAMTYSASRFIDPRYAGYRNATSNVAQYMDPEYLFANEVEGYIEGTSVFPSLSIIESTGATYYTKLQGGNQSANLTLTLPTAYAAVTGYVLASTDAGVLSWAANAGTFTGGNITSDITMANGVDILSSTTTAQTTGIMGYADAGSYKDVLRVTNGATVALVLGAADVQFSLLSTGLDVSTAGAVTGVTDLTATGTQTINASGAAATNIGTGTYSGAVTIGNNSASVAIASSGWDLTSGGALSGITTLSLSDDITMATGKGVKSSTTTAESVGVYGYDVGVGYVGALVVTNSTTPATVLGNTSGTTAVSSSDWTVSTSGDVAGIGALTMDGDFTSTDQFLFSFADNAEEGIVTTSATDYAADAAVLSINSTGAGATNNTYLLRLRNTTNADAQDHFLVVEDNAGDDKLAVNSGGTTTWTLDAAAKVAIDADTTNNTGTAGVLDIDFESATTGGEAINVKAISGVTTSETTAAITIDLDDDTAAAASIYGIDIAASDGTGSSVLYGINIATSIETHIKSVIPAAGTWATVDAATTDSTNSAGVLDIEFDTVTNNAEAVNIKATQITGGAGVAAAAIELELDSDSGNASDILYGLIVNATDTTATGKVKGLYVKGAGIDAAFQADTGYVRIGTGNTPDVTPSDDDLFMEGTLEVDGAARFDGGFTVTAGTVSINDTAAANTTSIGAGTTTGAITIGGTGTQAIGVGNGLGAKAVTVGSKTGASATIIQSGSADMDLDSASAVDIDAVTTFDVLAGGAFSIDGSNAASNISLATNGAADDLTIGLTGATDSSIILNSTGTGADAIGLVASAGSINVAAAAGGVDITGLTGHSIAATATADGSYGLEVSGAIAGATASEGVAAYFHSTISGNIDGKVYNLGSWLDITGGTPTDGPDALMASGDFGIYGAAAGAELATAQLRVLNLEYQVDADCAPVQQSSFIHFNTNATEDTPDYLFTFGNAASAVYTANVTHTAASTDKIGAIKVNILGVGDAYIYVYSSAGQ